ncbi:hypothetical protein Salat_0862700 [Sesamum alatum]|uniref:Uncharacterized protein n=1 Tax=Sesamum alatum TaxID=300844 RepID=A0AAE1YJ34_9LAMI|nr:hypothetical protein Salat_0862700 [Sesamum alatum]
MGYSNRNNPESHVRQLNTPRGRGTEGPFRAQDRRPDLLRLSHIPNTLAISTNALPWLDYEEEAVSDHGRVEDLRLGCKPAENRLIYFIIASHQLEVGKMVMNWSKPSTGDPLKGIREQLQRRFHKD